MKIIQHAVIAVALVLSGGVAMAATDEHQDDSNGFFALGAVTGWDDGPINTLSDEELSTIEGGLIGPERNLSDSPRWLWPVIRTASFGGSEVMFNPQPEPPGVGTLMNTMRYQYR